MGWIWHIVPENPESILCVMWETSVLVGQLLAVHEGLDDHGIINQFLPGKRFLLSSNHPDNLQCQPTICRPTNQPTESTTNPSTKKPTCQPTELLTDLPTHWLTNQTTD